MTFKIETIKKRVEVTFSDGSRLSGDLFLSPESPLHPGTELVSELFDSEKHFLPFELEKGQIVILKRSSIVMVRLDGNDQSNQVNSFIHIKPIEAQVCLISGDDIEGRVYLDLPESRSRLSDFLNYSKEFLFLETENEGYLINSQFIRMVRPGTSQ